MKTSVRHSAEDNIVITHFSPLATKKYPDERNSAKTLTGDVFHEVNDTTFVGEEYMLVGGNCQQKKVMGRLNS